MGRTKTATITSERLRERLDYDPETGIFTWRADGKGGRGIRRGARAGSVDPNGYRYIRIDQGDYLAQRLAWFWVNGAWPGFLRFADENKDNCAIRNLRDSHYVLSPDAKHNWRTKEGRAAQRKDYYAAARERIRNQQLKATFGIDLVEYKRKLAEQNGLCAICGNPETAKRNGKVRWLAVDHCHTSTKVRGLLCGNCNPMLGYAKDSVEVLMKAVDYLNRHSGD